MARGTWRRLSLLSMWATLVLHMQYVTTDVGVPCRFVKDWFPSDVKPQSSKPPYVLDVIRPDGKSVFEDMERWYRNVPRYGPDGTYTISLNGTQSETFIGFMIYVYNELEDGDSGHFVKPLPAGVSLKECHFELSSQSVERVENSTSGNLWTSLQVKWKTAPKNPRGKITISASVVKKKGVYWEGINLTLNCAVSITVGLASLLIITFALLSSLV